MNTEFKIQGLDKEYSNEKVKDFFLELIKNEDWKDGFIMANEPFKGKNGADKYYRTPFFGKITDGVKDLADSNLCFWFIDLIFILNTKSNLPREFQTWYFLIKDDVNYLIGEDGNQNVLVSYQVPSIDFADYGSTGVCLWLIDDLILLPEEY